MIETIKKFFKDDYLVSRSFPWTVNLTNFFFFIFSFYGSNFFSRPNNKTNTTMGVFSNLGNILFFLEEKTYKKIK
jgi:hypothetical protein